MSVNDVTGDKQATRPATNLYRENYDIIFDPFSSIWNQWIHHCKDFKPTNEDFARFFFDAGRNLK